MNVIYRSRSDRLVARGRAADFCRGDMAQMAVALARHRPGRRSAGAALHIRGAIQRRPGEPGSHHDCRFNYLVSRGDSARS
jgi:hypothetical protein